MFEQKTHYEVTKNEKTYTFICDSDSPLGALHDVLCEIKGAVVEKIQAVIEAEQKPKEEKINDHE